MVNLLDDQEKHGLNGPKCITAGCQSGQLRKHASGLRISQYNVFLDVTGTYIRRAQSHWGLCIVH